MISLFDFKYQLKNLPEKPGVYIMRNNLEAVIYVGKAKVLKNRVRQYFQNNKSHTAKVKAMVSNVSEFEYIVTDTEMEALILECNLIKKYRPKYNILLKDDKHYPFVKITVNEEFPRIMMTRRMARDGAKYFGPYPDVGAVSETMELMKKLFPIRTCRMSISENGKKIRPCLNYQIGLCSAPCAGFIGRKKYNEIVCEAEELLYGRNKKIVSKLKKDMEEASEKLEFEKAAYLRDKINAVEKVTERQKIMNDSFEDEDFISFYSDEKDTCMQVFFVRKGKVIGREHFMIYETCDMEHGEIVSGFIEEFYGGTAFVPGEIYVPEINDSELISKWLSMKKGSGVSIKVPQRGEKKEFLSMVTKNAEVTFKQFKLKLQRDKEFNENALCELSSSIGLYESPKRIEAFDISNIQGVDSVGSMIVFENGKAKNSDYRRFKIKTVKGANDYDSMREILERRFKRGMEEVNAIKESRINLSAGKFCIFPDLILMDGGKGQVNVALEVLKKFNINIPVCGMVKDDRHRTRGLIYNNNEIVFKSDSYAMLLITKIQDEVHRFAISYHRSLRDRRVLHSVLEDIPDIGIKRRRDLLMKFGSIENIKKASYEELISVPSVDKKAALSIKKFFLD